MGPPLDRDIVMGPPPTPGPSHPPGQKDKSDVTEKYRKLKRRYFELEEVSFFAGFVGWKTGERTDDTIAT
jgi:hypothetical protein